MCLTLFKDENQCELKVAQEDIVCYKMLLRVGFIRHNEGESCIKARWRSPYRGYRYEIGVLMESELDTPINRWDAISMIHRGLHTFASLDDAHSSVYGHYRFKARIPKGASYYEGIFITPFGDCKSYASNQLIVDELI